MRAQGCEIMTISFETACDRRVVVVTIVGSPTEADWPRFRELFLRAYADYSKFALLFDVRRMGLPSIPVIVSLCELMKSLKADTVRQVMAAIVLTDDAMTQQLILAVVRAAGQASLFYALSDAQEAADTAARLAALINALPGVCAAPLDSAALTWAACKADVVEAMLLVMFIRVMRHFLQRRRKLLACGNTLATQSACEPHSIGRRRHART